MAVATVVVVFGWGGAALWGGVRRARGSHDAVCWLVSARYCSSSHNSTSLRRRVASTGESPEHGEPRRKITVTELLGFTKVFELSVGDLLTAPELIPHQRAQKLCAQWIWRFNQFENALVSCDRARTKLAAHLADHPDATEALGAQVADYFKGGVAEADEIVDQVTAQAELIAELLEED